MQEKATRERNKDKSKQQFLEAVGHILKTKGLDGLKVNDIAQVAGLDKKLIYNYFGGTSGLLDAYIQSQDFWSNVRNEANTEDHGKAFTIQMLFDQFDYVFKNKELQKLLLWRLTEERQSLRQLTDAQEENGEDLFRHIADPYFGENAVQFRAIIALLISAVYYVNLYAEVNGSVFCGIDLKSDAGRSEIKQALKFLIEATYDKLPSP